MWNQMRCCTYHRVHGHSESNTKQNGPNCYLMGLMYKCVLMCFIWFFLLYNYCMLTLACTNPSQTPFRVYCHFNVSNISWKQRERSWAAVHHKCLDVATWLALSCSLKHVLYMFFFHRFSWERINSKIAQEVTAVCILFAPPPPACSTASPLPFPGNVATYPPYLHILFVGLVPCRPGFYPHLAWLLSVRGFPKPV